MSNLHANIIMELTRNGLTAFLKNQGYLDNLPHAIFDYYGSVWGFVEKAPIIAEKGVSCNITLTHVRDCYQFCLNHKDEILHWVAVFVDGCGHNPLTQEQFFALCYMPMMPSEHHKYLMDTLVKDLAQQVINAQKFYENFPEM
jgi:hypothetical protein